MISNCLKNSEANLLWEYLNIPSSIVLEFERILNDLFISLKDTESINVKEDELRRVLISSMLRVGVKLFDVKKVTTDLNDSSGSAKGETIELILERMLSKSWADSQNLSDKLSSVLNKREETSERLNRLFMSSELFFYHLQSVISQKHPGSLPDKFSELLGERSMRSEVVESALTRLYSGWDFLYSTLKKENFWYPPWEDLRGQHLEIEAIKDWLDAVAAYLGSQSPQSTDNCRRIYEKVWARLDPQLLRNLDSSIYWPVGLTLDKDIMTDSSI